MCASRLLSAILLAVLALTNSPNQSIDVFQIVHPQSRVDRALAWGQQYFSRPPWNVASAKEDDRTVFVAWNNVDCCAVANYYLDFGSAWLSLDHIQRYVNDDWIATKALNYSPGDSWDAAPPIML